jgi:hypothetical protein
MRLAGSAYNFELPQKFNFTTWQFIWGQSYKTFYGRTVLIIVIS